VASLGAGLAADFEIGSVSKGVTGLLYAEALTRDEIGTSTTLGDLLPLAQTSAAHVSLAALSTHRSGLPMLPRSAAPLRRTLELWRRGTNPYGEDLATLLRQARDNQVGRPRPRYSSFGFEFLGHALAHAAGTTYPDLVHQRIVEPLGLSTLYAPARPADLRSTALTGRSRRGRPREPWTGEALAPAGGLRASITDMARLTQALLDGTAPGRAARDPTASFPGRGVRIGAAWITLSHHGHQITWHNGGTGGLPQLDRSRPARRNRSGAALSDLGLSGFPRISDPHRTRRRWTVDPRKRNDLRDTQSAPDPAEHRQHSREGVNPRRPARNNAR